MKRCTVLVAMIAMFVLASATPAEACRGLFRRGLFRCWRARPTCVKQAADKADAKGEAGVTDRKPSGTPGTISPKPASKGDAAGPAGKDEKIIDVDPAAKAPAKPAAKKKAPVVPPAAPTKAAPGAPAPAPAAKAA